MKHITKPSNHVNVEPDQVKDLEKLIEGLRNDIILPKTNKKTVPAEIGDKRRDHPAVQRSSFISERARAFHESTLGVAHRIPA